MLTATAAVIVSEQQARLRQKLDVIERRLNDQQGKPATERELRDMTDIQERFDGTFRDLSMPGAPGPLGNESPASYRLRLLTTLQPHSPDWRDAPLYRLPSSTLGPIENQIIHDAQRVAKDPSKTFKQGTLRERKTLDESGRAATEFHGDPLVWMNQFMPPRTVVAGWHDPRTGRPPVPGFGVADRRR